MISLTFRFEAPMDATPAKDRLRNLKIPPLLGIRLVPPGGIRAELGVGSELVPARDEA